MITPLVQKNLLLDPDEFAELVDFTHSRTRPYGKFKKAWLFRWKKTPWWQRLFFRRLPNYRRALIDDSWIAIQYADNHGVALDALEQEFGGNA